jgi:hypothetical protein
MVNLKILKRPLISSLIAGVAYFAVYSSIKHFVEKSFTWRDSLLSTLVFFLAFFIMMGLLNRKKNDKKMP